MSRHFYIECEQTFVISCVPMTTRAFGPRYPQFKDMRSFLAKN